jgi:hypothetical protein
MDYTCAHVSNFAANVPRIRTIMTAEKEAKSAMVDQPLSSRLQPPLPILIKILSYIEHEMDYDAPCGVNQQWLMASQQVPNTTVKWVLGVGFDDILPSFTLAIRKHPRATSFLRFPFRDLEALMTHDSYDLSTLRSISLRTRKANESTDHIESLCQQLSSPSSICRSVSIHSPKKSDESIIKLRIGAARTLLRSFNDGYLKGTMTDKDVPKIRFNGRRPVKCPKLPPKHWNGDKEEYPYRHGYTYTERCSECKEPKRVCCTEFSTCIAEYGGCDQIWVPLPSLLLT